MADQLQLLWLVPDWQKHAHEWIRIQAQRNSIHLTGEIEQNHAYAWSTVMRVPTDAGTLFFKATAGETIYEAALTEMLAKWFPDCMPELVAVDTARGWMLMRDGGEPLRASIRPAQDIKPWESVIRRYAEVQIDLAGHVSQLLALRIPDHRLAVLPARYAELLADEASLMIDQEKGLTTDQVRQLQALAPRFEQICADLSAFGIPETLNHGDFHDGNVLVKNGRITFSDWGDATITHPFISLRTWFVSMEIALGMDEDYPAPTPEMIAMLDRYLERWEHFASGNDLLHAYALSKPVASIVKALLWHSTISQLEGSLRKEYEWIVPELFREFMYNEKGLDAA